MGGQGGTPSMERCSGQGSPHELIEFQQDPCPLCIEMQRLEDALVDLEVARLQLEQRGIIPGF